jgi:hypothetical protein
VFADRCPNNFDLGILDRNGEHVIVLVDQRCYQRERQPRSSQCDRFWLGNLASVSATLVGPVLHDAWIAVPSTLSLRALATSPSEIRINSKDLRLCLAQEIGPTASLTIEPVPTQLKPVLKPRRHKENVR